MFLGYQKGKITFIADSMEALENMPCVVLDKIEKSAEDIVLTNDGYRKKSQLCPSDVNETARTERRYRFERESDVMLLEELEKVTDIPELFEVLKKWKAKKNLIRSELAYV